MPVELRPILLADKAALKAVMNPYLVEHADQVDPARVHGDPTAYEHLDLYWVEPERRPWWIMADGARVGFVLVNAYSPSGLGTDRSISEFHIDPGLRRTGLGSAAARAALATHAGLWELQVFRANTGGLAFWPRALASAGVSARQVLQREDRVIHRFRT